jgi:hypothetical protein
MSKQIFATVFQRRRGMTANSLRALDMLDVLAALNSADLNPILEGDT